MRGGERRNKKKKKRKREETFSTLLPFLSLFHTLFHARMECWRRKNAVVNE
jgi:hypothetical protein